MPELMLRNRIQSMVHQVQGTVGMRLTDGKLHLSNPMKTEWMVLSIIVLSTLVSVKMRRWMK